ncbi:MAG: prefoldin subunit alpha [Desulfurococcaceae archaeon]
MSSSKQEKGAGEAISVDELVAKAGELKDHIDTLNATLNIYLNQYREIQLASETLRNLPQGNLQGYLVLDRLSSALVPANISDSWFNSVLVNLGLGYYVKADRDKAVEVLSKRVQELEKVINTLQAQQKAAVEQYLSIQRLINQVIGAQQSKSQK